MTDMEIQLCTGTVVAGGNVAHSGPCPVHPAQAKAEAAEHLAAENARLRQELDACRQHLSRATTDRPSATQSQDQGEAEGAATEGLAPRAGRADRR